VEKDRDAGMDLYWERYLTDRDPDAKNELLTHYLYLVVAVVKRMMPQYRDYCDKDDLVSSGTLGLIDAVEKYDPAFNVKFQTYATIRIRGEVIDYLRRQDWASTGLRRKITSIQRGFETLESELHRSPTEKEVAELLGISEQEVTSALQQSEMFNVVNFEAMVYEKENENAAPTALHDPYRVVENQEMQQALRTVIGSLPEKERMVIVLHYYEGLTMKNIAKILGVSESRVSQIHSKTLLKMRQAIETA
jgi:RNA polymerase sigma factor for flagellar operon FliA